jgi:predicted nucleic acid-binding protein
MDKRETFPQIVLEQLVERERKTEKNVEIDFSHFIRKLTQDES